MLSKENITTQELASIFKEHFPWFEIEGDMDFYSWLERLGSNCQEALVSFYRYIDEMKKVERALNAILPPSR